MAAVEVESDTSAAVQNVTGPLAVMVGDGWRGGGGALTGADVAAHPLPSKACTLNAPAVLTVIGLRGRTVGPEPGGGCARGQGDAVARAEGRWSARSDDRCRRRSVHRHGGRGGGGTTAGAVGDVNREGAAAADDDRLRRGAVGPEPGEPALAVSVTLPPGQKVVGPPALIVGQAEER